MSALLEVRNLQVQFKTDDGIVEAVNSISYEIYEGEIVGLVGESGCGKSVSQLAILQLIPTPPGKITAGEVKFEGYDLLKFKGNSKEMNLIRGRKIGFIFQEPMTSLNPVLTIGDQLTEILELHLKMQKDVAQKRAEELLKMVGIPDAARRMRNYPHQFSGGMRQRIMIAIAISCSPKIIIADEPTTALDVTTQAQLLELMKDMVTRFGASLLIVTHNLGVVARYAQRIYVMYAGQIIESGSAKEIFSNPQHPYTIGLLKAVPRLDEPKGRKLIPIYGAPPNLIDMPNICAFYPRCSYSSTKCKDEQYPNMREVAANHFIRCHVDITKGSERSGS